MRQGGLIRGVLGLCAVAALAVPAAALAGGPLSINGHVAQRTDLGVKQDLAGATVELQTPEGSPITSTTTDGSGNYGFASVGVGSYHVVASKTDYVTQCRTYQQNGSPDPFPEIELPKPAQAGTINGHVTDSFTDAPIQGVTVEVSYDQGCNPPATAQTAADGLYVFPTGSLAGPVHLVTYSLAGYNTRTDVYDVFTGPVHDVELEPVDSTDPKTKIKSVSVHGHKVTVKFKINDPPPSSGGLNATCEIDHLGGDECVSPQTITGIPKGRHKIKVTGFDSAGNFDETPAKERFRIG